MKSHLALVEPSNVNRKVAPILTRGTNADARSREYLLPAEIDKVIKAAKDGRWDHRDATLVLPSGTACAPLRLPACNGTRSSSADPRGCTFAG